MRYIEWMSHINLNFPQKNWHFCPKGLKLSIQNSKENCDPTGKWNFLSRPVSCSRELSKKTESKNRVSLIYTLAEMENNLRTPVLAQRRKKHRRSQMK